MKRTGTYRNRFGRHLALGLAIAAVAAPIGQAGSSIPTELSGRQLAPSTLRLVTIPEELSGRQLGPTLAGAEIDARPGTIPPELDGRQFGPSSLPRTIVPADISGRDFGPSASGVGPAGAIDGFDWRDAGVGAAVVVAMCLLLGAIALLVGRRRLPASSQS